MAPCGNVRCPQGGDANAQEEPPYTLKLTTAQRSELEARARRYTLPYRDVVRAKVVLMAADGLDNDEIAARLDTRRAIVSKWRKRFYLQGLAGLEERPRGGRPPVFPLIHPVKALACELPSRLGVPCSRLHVPDISAEVVYARHCGQSRGPPSGAGCQKTPSDHGAAGRGSFPATVPSRPRPPGCSTSTQESGKKGPLAKRTMWSPPMRRPPSRPAFAAMRAFVLRLGARDTSNSSTTVAGRFSTWLPGMCTGPRSSGAVRPGAVVAVRSARRPGDQRRSLYASARRVFWVVDNGSSHRGRKAADRLRERWPKLVLVHVPVHASWLNQVEIYFSVIQRKVLTPNDFADLGEIEERLLAFERRYEQSAAPFEWKFTRSDLALLMKKLADKPDYQAAA